MTPGQQVESGVVRRKQLSAIYAAWECAPEVHVVVACTAEDEVTLEEVEDSKFVVTRGNYPERPCVLRGRRTQNLAPNFYGGRRRQMGGSHTARG